MFGAPELLAVAKKRFGEDILRSRMLGSAATASDQDRELTRIALSVVGRVQAAVTPSVGWPIPEVWPVGSLDENGNNLGGVAFKDRWPYDLLQHALELFNWRTLSGSQEVSEQQRRIGAMAERYFDELARGLISLGIGGMLEVAGAEVLIARNRDGSSNIAGIPDTDPVLDTFHDFAWDYIRP